MDFFGIGNALMGAFGLYKIMARQTGRTMNMVNSLHPDDVVVVTNAKEGKRIMALCQDRNIDKVSFVVCDPKTPQDLFNHPTPRGRMIFDHSWVEDFYQYTLEKAKKDIDYLQDQLSGYGEAHIETRMAAREYHKMAPYIPG